MLTDEDKELARVTKDMTDDQLVAHFNDGCKFTVNGRTKNMENEDWNFKNMEELRRECGRYGLPVSNRNFVALEIELQEAQVKKAKALRQMYSTQNGCGAAILSGNTTLQSVMRGCEKLLTNLREKCGDDALNGVAEALCQGNNTSGRGARSIKEVDDETRRTREEDQQIRFSWPPAGPDSKAAVNYKLMGPA